MTVCCCARPAVCRGSSYHAGPHGVPLHVTDRVPRMKLIEDAREWPFLPEMTDVAVLPIKSLRVRPVDPMKYAMNRVEAFRDRNVVDVIRHQAVSDDTQSKVTTTLREQR